MRKTFPFRALGRFRLTVPTGLRQSRRFQRVFGYLVTLEAETEMRFFNGLLGKSRASPTRIQPLTGRTR